MGPLQKAALAAALSTKPSASAADIPALADLLDRAGWEATPELSGVFQPGSVFMETENGHTEMIRDCFEAAPASNTYTAAEIVTQLQAGVRFGAGIGRFGASGGIEKRVSFDTPVHTTIERLAMIPTPMCLNKLSRASEEARRGMYVVQEVLSAVITEQTCGKVDVRGQFVGLGSAEASASRACARESLEPVAVGYRVIPIADLLVATTHRVIARDPIATDDAVELINWYSRATWHVGERVEATLTWNVTRTKPCIWHLEATASVPPSAIASVGERHWRAEFDWNLAADPIRGMHVSESARWGFPSTAELPIATVISITFEEVSYPWTGNQTGTSIDRYGFQLALSDRSGAEPVKQAIQAEVDACAW